MSEVFLALCTLHPITGKPKLHVSYKLDDTELSECLYPHFQKACNYLKGHGQEVVLEVVPGSKTGINNEDTLMELYQPFLDVGKPRGLLDIVVENDYLDVSDKIESFLNRLYP